MATLIGGRTRGDEVPDVGCDMEAPPRLRIMCVAGPRGVGIGAATVRSVESCVTGSVTWWWPRGVVAAMRRIHGCGSGREGTRAGARVGSNGRARSRKFEAVIK